MPPYDPFEGTTLLAEMIRLSNERDRSWRRTKKGDKRPLADVEAQRASRGRNIQARRDAALDALAASRKRVPPAKGADIASRMLRAMEPGQWYGVGDMMRLAGAARHERGKVTQVMLRREWVEVTQNPAWNGGTPSPDEIEAGAEPHPRRLYRVTAKGLARLAAVSEPE